jgi:serine protease AprX
VRLTRPVLVRVFVAALLAVAVQPSHRVDALSALDKLDPLLRQRTLVIGRSRVIVQAADGQALSLVLPAIQLAGGRIVRPLPLIDGLAIDVPNAALALLATNSGITHLALDRLVAGSMERTGTTIGATAVRSRLGLDGSGVGVAVIDSGVTPWHDDLSGAPTAQRVDRFVDFTAGRTSAYDDFGHGTHVAGIVSGNGSDSSGARTGIAPGAHVTVLKVLDAQGQGRISDVIAALGYAVTNRDVLAIRVINLSVATGVYESYMIDPLTVAARHAVDAGIVVVAAAGNNGRSSRGRVQYGGITAPGNAPWVLTVGASSHMGTVDRSDDTVAAFSSRGPAAVDENAKPDLVAPGVGIESLSNPESGLYAAHPEALLDGTIATAFHPYMSLSGTSMSAPVVTGTVALMLQAYPSLTPNAVKAILQFTAQTYAGYDPLTQGAGFLNADGAVSLAAWYASPLTRPYPDYGTWSRHIIWGNRMLDGPGVSPDLVSWAVGAVWGDPLQTTLLSLNNVVWGPLCAGLDCAGSWNAGAVTTTSDPESDTVVCGTTDGEGDTVVWGTSCGDPSCATVVWGRP